MAANIEPLPHRRDIERPTARIDDPEADPVLRAAAQEDARVAAADDAAAMRRLAPAPSRARMIAGGVAAVMIGGSVGYWLGGRQWRRTPTRARRAASTADSLIELAPVAMHLLGNPLVRTMAMRMVLRQLRRH